MKTILAYGDSLTFGHDTASGLRHAYEDRWPTVLEAGLGGQARVIADGLSGRTTMFDDHGAAADRNGARVLPTVLSVHAPLDAVVIMLGANDLKPFICGAANGAAAGMRRLAQIVKSHPYGYGGGVPELILVSPPHAGRTDRPGGLPVMDRSIAESEKLAGLYRDVADEFGAKFFDASTVATPTRLDGVHLDAEATRAIGSGVVPVVKQALGLA